jgi:hypothetical protein
MSLSMQNADRATLERSSRPANDRGWRDRRIHRWVIYRYCLLQRHAAPSHARIRCATEHFEVVSFESLAIRNLARSRIRLCASKPLSQFARHACMIYVPI